MAANEVESSPSKPRVVAKNFGYVPGIEVGMCWKTQPAAGRVHCHPITSVHGQANLGAFSIVLSSGSDDDKDDGDEFTYTGSGGSPSYDQELKKSNIALARNCNIPLNPEGGRARDWKGGRPIRVLRSYKARDHSKYAPEEGYRYDGLYRVVQYWKETGKSGYAVWRYLLRRDDPTPAPWTEEGKLLIQQKGFTMQYSEEGKQGSPTIKKRKRRKGEEKDVEEDNNNNDEEEDEVEGGDENLMPPLTKFSRKIASTESMPLGNDDEIRDEVEGGDEGEDLAQPLNELSSTGAATDNIAPEKERSIDIDIRELLVNGEGGPITSLPAGQPRERPSSPIPSTSGMVPKPPKDCSSTQNKHSNLRYVNMIPDNHGDFLEDNMPDDHGDFLEDDMQNCPPEYANQYKMPKSGSQNSKPKKCPEFRKPGTLSSMLDKLEMKLENFDPSKIKILDAKMRSRGMGHCGVRKSVSVVNGPAKGGNNAAASQTQNIKIKPVERTPVSSRSGSPIPSTSSKDQSGNSCSSSSKTAMIEKQSQIINIKLAEGASVPSACGGLSASTSPEESHDSSSSTMDKSMVESQSKSINMNTVKSTPVALVSGGPSTSNLPEGPSRNSRSVSSERTEICMFDMNAVERTPVPLVSGGPSTSNLPEGPSRNSRSVSSERTEICMFDMNAVERTPVSLVSGGPSTSNLPEGPSRNSRSVSSERTEICMFDMNAVERTPVSLVSGGPSTSNLPEQPSHDTRSVSSEKTEIYLDEDENPNQSCESDGCSSVEDIFADTPISREGRTVTASARPQGNVTAERPAATAVVDVQNGPSGNGNGLDLQALFNLINERDKRLQEQIAAVRNHTEEISEQVNNILHNQFTLKIQHYEDQMAEKDRLIEQLQRNQLTASAVAPHTRLLGYVSSGQSNMVLPEGNKDLENQGSTAGAHDTPEWGESTLPRQRSGPFSAHLLQSMLNSESPVHDSGEDQRGNGQKELEPDILLPACGMENQAMGTSVVEKLDEPPTTCANTSDTNIQSSNVDKRPTSVSVVEDSNKQTTHCFDDQTGVEKVSNGVDASATDLQPGHAQNQATKMSHSENLEEPPSDHADASGSNLLEPPSDHADAPGSNLLEPPSDHAEAPGSNLLQPPSDHADAPGSNLLQPPSDHADAPGSNLLQPPSDHADAPGSNSLEPPSDHADASSSNLIPRDLENEATQIPDVESLVVQPLECVNDSQPVSDMSLDQRDSSMEGTQESQESASPDETFSVYEVRNSQSNQDLSCNSQGDKRLMLKLRKIAQNPVATCSADKDSEMGVERGSDVLDTSAIDSLLHLNSPGGDKEAEESEDHMSDASESILSFQRRDEEEPVGINEHPPLGKQDSLPPQPADCLPSPRAMCQCEESEGMKENTVEENGNMPKSSPKQGATKVKRKYRSWKAVESEKNARTVGCDENRYNGASFVGMNGAHQQALTSTVNQALDRNPVNRLPEAQQQASTSTVNQALERNPVNGLPEARQQTSTSTVYQALERNPVNGLPEAQQQASTSAVSQPLPGKPVNRLHMEQGAHPTLSKILGRPSISRGKRIDIVKRGKAEVRKRNGECVTITYDSFSDFTCNIGQIADYSQPSPSPSHAN